MTADNWLLDVKLRVTGRGRVGADGMVRRQFLLDSNRSRDEGNLFFSIKNS